MGGTTVHGDTDQKPGVRLRVDPLYLIHPQVLWLVVVFNPEYLSDPPFLSNSLAALVARSLQGAPSAPTHLGSLHGHSC